MGDHLVTHKECEEQKRLEEELSQATKALFEMQVYQVTALKLGDHRVSRFDEEINATLRAWRNARRAYMEHLQDHRCSNG